MLFHANLTIVYTFHGSIAMEDIFFTMVVFKSGGGLLLGEVQSLLIYAIDLSLYFLQFWVYIEKVGKTSVFWS